MDGPWQIGHMTATEYGMKAQDTARQMRAVKPASLKLIACGSSNPGMPTYLEWDREVLEQCYEYVDALSLHRYFGNTQEETGGDSAKFVAMNLSMERQIAETLSVCDLVRGRKRSPKDCGCHLTSGTCGIVPAMAKRRMDLTPKRRICWKRSITWKMRC